MKRQRIEVTYKQMKREFRPSRNDSLSIYNILADLLLRMTFREAEKIANQHHVTLRVATINGTDIPLTSEFVPYRLHVAVERDDEYNHIITRVYPDFG